MRFLFKSFKMPQQLDKVYCLSFETWTNYTTLYIKSLIYKQYVFQNFILQLISKTILILGARLYQIYLQ